MKGVEHIGGWTEPRIARLKKLWAEGLSASQIARDLGQGVTRNAVIAKVHRLRLSSPDRAKARVTQARPKSRPKAAPKPSTTAVPRKDPQPLPPEPVVEGTPRLITLLELEGHACKWPVGMPHPVQRFCGLRREEDGPYCAFHARASRPSTTPALGKAKTGEALARQLRRYL